jgi:coenzyme F420-0:L-glutamate ligase/coenzyme F420-1:gamma-L-glutamate ligase
VPEHQISIRGIAGIPEIVPGDNLSERIVAALRNGSEAAPLLEPGTIFVIAQKVVSKAEGRLLRLDSVVPSPEAERWAERFQRDPRMVEAVLREARRVVRMDRGVLIVETHHGFVCANGGVDASNAPAGTVVLLPEDPDASADRLRRELEDALDCAVAVIISDTFGRPWRQGLANVALGVAGLSPFIDYRGKVDSYGRSLHATVLAVADELASAAELVMGKTLGIPVALIEGFGYEPASGSGKDLIRPPDEDLFR